MNDSIETSTRSSRALNWFAGVLLGHLLGVVVLAVPFPVAMPVDRLFFPIGCTGVFLIFACECFSPGQERVWLSTLHAVATLFLILGLVMVFSTTQWLASLVGVALPRNEVLSKSMALSLSGIALYVVLLIGYAFRRYCRNHTVADG